MLAVGPSEHDSGGGVERYKRRHEGTGKASEALGRAGMFVVTRLLLHGEL